MNGIPMRFDYSKTINEQLPTFNYYKDRYCSYELEIMKLQQENQQLKVKITLRNKEKTDICNKIQNQREKNKRHRIAITNLITKNKQLKEKIKGFENPITYFNYANKTLKDENIQLRTEISAREEEYKKLENKVNKIIETIDEELIYDKGTDITSAIGDVGEKMKFYLSDCEFLNEFRKLERGVSDVED